MKNLYQQNGFQHKKRTDEKLRTKLMKFLNTNAYKKNYRKKTIQKNKNQSHPNNVYKAGFLSEDLSQTTDFFFFILLQIKKQQANNIFFLFKWRRLQQVQLLRMKRYLEYKRLFRMTLE